MRSIEDCTYRGPMNLGEWSRDTLARRVNERDERIEVLEAEVAYLRAKIEAIHNGVHLNVTGFEKQARRAVDLSREFIRLQTRAKGGA